MTDQPGRISKMGTNKNVMKKIFYNYYLTIQKGSCMDSNVSNEYVKISQSDMNRLTEIVESQCKEGCIVTISKYQKFWYALLSVFSPLLLCLLLIFTNVQSTLLPFLDNVVIFSILVLTGIVVFINIVSRYSSDRGFLLNTTLYSVIRKDNEIKYTYF